MDADIAALEAGGLAPEDEFEMDEAMEDELFYGGAPMEAEAMDAAAPAAAPLPVPAAAPAPAPAPAPAAPPAPARYTIPVPTEDGELAMVRVLLRCGSFRACYSKLSEASAAALRRKVAEPSGFAGLELADTGYELSLIHI